MGSNNFFDSFVSRHLPSLRSKLEMDTKQQLNSRNARSISDYHRSLEQEASRRRAISPETQEENELYYRGGSGYKGEFFFKLWNPSDPLRVRLRIERLYWEHWESFCLAIFLTGMGINFFCMGLDLLLREHKNFTHAICMMGISLFPAVPGLYVLFFVWKYLRCCKGYSLATIP